VGALRADEGVSEEEGGGHCAEWEGEELVGSDGGMDGAGGRRGEREAFRGGHHVSARGVFLFLSLFLFLPILLLSVLASRNGRQLTLSQVVRTRLRQAPTVAGGKPKYTGLVQCFKLVWKEEGMASMYGGLTPHLLRTVPSAAIMFGMYEVILKLLDTPS